MENLTKNFTRDDYILLSKMSLKTERFEEMLEYINKFVKMDKELNSEERSIVSTAYKKIISNKRTEWQVLQDLKTKEESKGNQINVNNVKKYILHIESEIQRFCNDILNLLEKYLIVNSKNIKSKVFYLKMKGLFSFYIF